MSSIAEATGKTSNKVEEVDSPCRAHRHDLAKLLKSKPATGVNKP
jgi:hypothetical protein